MSLTEEVSFDNDGQSVKHSVFDTWFRKLFLAIIIILVAVLSFGIGRLSVVGEREPIRIEYNPEISNYSKQVSISNTQTTVVTSKNGSKYHYAHCAGAKQIKEENKITFASASAAEAAGYTLASNCSPR